MIHEGKDKFIDEKLKEKKKIDLKTTSKKGLEIGIERNSGSLKGGKDTGREEK